MGSCPASFFFFLNLSKGRSPSRQRPVLGVFVRSTAQEVSPAAHGRDAGCGCCSAGTSQPPRVTHRRQLAWGSCLGECVPGHGAPQPAETVWGGWDPLALQHWGKMAAAAVPWGCCSGMLLLPPPPLPPAAPLYQFFPQCVITRGWHNPGHVDLLLTPGEVCSMWLMGWILPFSKSTVASAKSHLSRAATSGADVISWSPERPDPPATKSNHICWLLGL